ncbi:MAG TPA: hypothetical protein VG454_04350 [Gemmatimonadales bacterium]|nr:hypothetical protein [Gemmatimonadales bacterium]
MAEEKTPHVPKAGEFLVLPDGRRFVVAETQNGARGWWFLATAQDGGCTLQGNLQLEWDSQAEVWRPAGARVPVPRSMTKPSQPRLRQLD